MAEQSARPQSPKRVRKPVLPMAGLEEVVKPLLDVYQRHGTGVIELKEVPRGQEHLYGVIEGTKGPEVRAGAQRPLDELGRG